MLYRIAPFAACAILLGWAQSASAQLPSPDFFPIGVHSQPFTSFGKWKSRGINTMVQFEDMNETVAMETWDNAADAAGLKYIRAQTVNPSNDLQKPNLLAWALEDEPDLPNHDPRPARIIDIYQNLKAVSPSKPVWVNFAGPLVTPATSNYTEWVKGADWIASDWYPLNWNRPQNINFVGLQIDRLRAAANGAPKKYMVYIEAAYANAIPGRVPTPHEFRAEIWNGINHGATGIVYFPQYIGGVFSFDAAPPDIVAEMMLQNDKMRRLGGVLNKTWNPSSRGVTLSDPVGLEASWRSTPDGDYFFVLSMSPNPITDATITLTGLPAGITLLDVFDESRTETLVNGKITDSFAPYELHVYRTSTAGAQSLDIAAVPEPGTIGLLTMMSAAALLRRRKR